MKVASWSKTLKIEQDPDTIEIYRWDWANWLGCDKIQTATVFAESGITASVVKTTDTYVDVSVSGGTAGVSYKVTCRVTTDRGRQQDRSVTFVIKDL